MKIGKLGLLLFFALTLIAARGCRIGNGTIEGTVTDSITSQGLAGVEVTVTPGIIISASQATEPVVVTTDASGAYSASVPAGSYSLSFALENYTSASGTASIGKRVTATVNAVLEPLSVAGKGTIQGTVTNSLTDTGIEGASVTLTPETGEPTVVQTDASGAYSALVPAGSYSLAFEATNYTTANDSAAVAVKATKTANAALEPTAKVIVSAGPDQEGEFDASINLNGSVEILDGSTLESIEWTQTTGPASSIADSAVEDTTATLPTYEASKGALLAGLEQIDRLMVQGINPHALEGAKTVTFKITVITSSGTYSDSAVVELPLPLQVSTGIRNVPINVPVLLHGTNQASYGWEILSKPGNSAASLVDSTTQDPYFTPDVSGAYLIEQEITEATITVFAGTYVGGINGQDASGNPTMTCSQCHSATVNEWAPSGHAHIFSDNVNTSDHYSESCLPCHTVGYLSGANGIDQASDWDAFIDSGLLHDTSPTNWTTILADYPATAQLSNIQCENCHGPQASGIHVQGREARISISSDVCGTCHGEPPRHGRYQQWEESGHANFELAIEEGTSGNCGRCHGGQGFIEWIKQGGTTTPIQGASGDATEEELIALGMVEDKVQPQTCAVCHDPHYVGTVSGDANDAPMRVEGDTPVLLAGFAADNVGRGAICFMCHNSRRGLHNDANPPTDYRAPHAPTQADVMMGQNAFFVQVQRSSHANLKDSCATCHMEATPPPAGFSYNQSGTNHSFAASITICVQCHTGIDGTALQGSTEVMFENLTTAIETAAIAKLNALGTIKVRAYDPATRLYSSSTTSDSNVTIDVSTNNIIGCARIEASRHTFAVTLTSPIDITWTDSSTTNTNQFQVQLESLKDETDTVVYAAAGNMAKAFWNCALVEQDLSKGVHNPSFVSDVLITSAGKDLSF